MINFFNCQVVFMLFRDDFVQYAKSCVCVKDYLDKVTREQSRSGGGSRQAPSVTVDKASAAFRAIDKDNSGYVDREEFLQFTR